MSNVIEGTAGASALRSKTDFPLLLKVLISPLYNFAIFLVPLPPPPVLNAPILTVFPFHVRFICIGRPADALYSFARARGSSAVTAFI